MGSLPQTIIFGNFFVPSELEHLAANSVIRESFKRRLDLLLHSASCLNNKEENGNENKQCTGPYCEYMKGLWIHIRSCPLDESCKVPNCYSSKIIIEHFNGCEKENCLICSINAENEININECDS